MVCRKENREKRNEKKKGQIFLLIFNSALRSMLNYPILLYYASVFSFAVAYWCSSMMALVSKGIQLQLSIVVTELCAFYVAEQFLRKVIYSRKSCNS
jgi:positive regulator of sigma E activity